MGMARRQRPWGCPVSILEFLGFGQSRDDVSGESPAETETVRRIVDRLDHLEPERARFVAAFAYVLSRVAHADLKISEDETRAMERIVPDHGGLPEGQAVMHRPQPLQRERSMSSVPTSMGVPR